MQFAPPVSPRQVGRVLFIQDLGSGGLSGNFGGGSEEVPKAPNRGTKCRGGGVKIVWISYHNIYAF